MKINIKKYIRKYAIITLGVIMVAFAICCFYTPNKIVSGGVSGISTILYHTLGIPVAASFATINIILLAIAFFLLGREFIIDTLLGAGLLSVLTEIFSFLPAVTSDVLLASVFGSVLYGVGIGLALVEGASTGGTDILCRILQRFFPHIKAGTVLFIIDMSVIIASVIIFRQIDLALYGLIALFMSSFSINWLIGKLNISKLAFVVTDKGEEIAKYLVSHSPRGVTLLDATGAYTMEKRNVLICALKEQEAELFQKRILKLDGNAFIIFSESSQIVGNGFRVYK